MKNHNNGVTTFHAHYKSYTGGADKYGASVDFGTQDNPVCDICGEALLLGLCLSGKNPFLHKEFPNLHSLLFFQCKNHNFETAISEVWDNSKTKRSYKLFSGATPMEISWKKQTDPDPSTYTENDIDKLHNEENSDLLQHLDHDKLGGLFPFVDHGNSTANQLGCIGKLKWFDFESDFYLFFVNNQFLIEFP